MCYIISLRYTKANYSLFMLCYIKPAVSHKQPLVAGDCSYSYSYVIFQRGR